MKKKYILIAFLSVIYSSIQAQLADITYSIRTGNITSYYANDCWESGTEEYTGYLDSWDNVNGTWVGTGCQQCNATYDCTYATNIALQTRSNNAYNVTFRIDAWEDDNGSRCSFATGWYIDDDDCRRNETNNINIRELVYPSNGTYSNTATWGGTNNHNYYFQYTWKYSGTASLITPNLTCQSSAVTSGAIRSWSVNLTAGQTYAFSNYGSGADTKMRLYSTDGYTIVATADDNGPHVAGTAASLEYTATATGTYYLELTNYDRAVLSTNSTLYYWQKPSSVAGFGTNSWNILGYNKNDITLSGATYVGNYNINSLSYNTSGQWTNSPTDAAGWSGGCVHPDYHTVVAKRQGFPCKIYQIDIPAHDDDIQVFINGAKVYEHLGGCCDVHNNIWTGYLTSTSTIEVRHIDGVGGSVQALTFTDVTTTLSGGTIAGIANPTSVCTGTDPGAFTSTAAASGGTIGITNGSPAAPTYQWERAPTSGFASITNVGTNATTYDPDASLAAGTYYFRRKVTDACGTVAYSNVIQVNVVATPSGGSIATVSYCSGTGSASVAITGVTNATDYVWSLPAGLTGSSTTSSITVSGSTAGTYTVTATPRDVASGITCTGTAVTGIVNVDAVTVAGVAGTAGAGPTICISNSTTLILSGNTGTTIQWQQSPTTGGAYTNVSGGSGATTTTYTTPTLTSNTCYRAVVTNGTCPSANSAVQCITVSPNITGNTVSSAQTICTGNTPSSLSGSLPTGGNGSFAYEWQSSNTSSSTGFSAASGTNNTQNYSPAALSQTTWYRRKVTSGGCENISAAIQITVEQLPTTANAGADDSTCGKVFTLAGSTVTTGIGTWSQVSGPSTAVFSNVNDKNTTATVTIGGVYTYRWTTSNGTCPNSTDDVDVKYRTIEQNAYLVNGGTFVAAPECTDNDGWTYYSLSTDKNKWIFGIYKNNNTINGDVTITDVANVIKSINTATTGHEHGSSLLSRYWDFNCTSCSGSNPMKVRFFIDPSERSAAISDNVSNHAPYAGHTFITPWRWFKSANGTAFNNALISSQIDGNDFNFTNITLSEDATATLNGVTYVELSGLNGFSGGTGGIGFSPGSGAPLPVTYLSFKATAVENSYIRLDWTTASERDNKGFVIERSEDGRTWSNIGWVDGNGNTTSAMSYSFDDQHVAPNVVYYYRLRQTDFSGREDLSNIVSAYIVTDAKFVISEFIPNKVETTSELQIFTSTDRKVKVDVYNALGQKVNTVERQLIVGNNVIKFDFSHLASGTYSASITSNGEFVGRKFVVVK